ncbi:MAG TPA: aminotransferase class I/II-fold pyridoxal phosphate-dependent enzyme [Vitreimonas sp.]|nr:aminotransferase class I/II-fold pyridoxal phosphate-dependent enzyme [Vitreimonas sp.]
MPNLTESEIIASRHLFNFTDGHSRRPFSAPEYQVLLKAAEFLQEPIETVGVLADRFVAAFYELAQQSFDLNQDNYLLFPSASLATDVVAQLLTHYGHTQIAVIEPCFDNLPDLLKLKGLTVVPIGENELGSQVDITTHPATALLLVDPNNPTGFMFNETQFRAIVEQCVKSNKTLVLDATFRFYKSPADSFDQLAILKAAGAEYIIIEDTGKTWPSQEQKISILTYSPHFAAHFYKLYTIYYLSPSPAALQLLTGYVQATAADNFDHLHSLIIHNRRFIAEAIKGTGIQMAEAELMPVCWLRLPDHVSACSFVDELENVQPSIRILEGQPFFWSDETGEKGAQYVRIALSRNPHLVMVAAEKIKEVARRLKM